MKFATQGLRQPGHAEQTRLMTLKEFIGEVERLALKIREIFIAEVRDYHAKRSGLPSCYTPPTRWDGGTDAAGRRHAAIWPQIAIFMLKNDVEPVAFIRAQFGPTHRLPTPGTLLTAAALERYRQKVKKG
ncbi:MAG TPA: hypothetical protein VGP63_17090 [Planctomycetaceae bacterium]|jgi:hypothetical protein|nr:hypothetical protein [Planctomycetaceae bacterium]